jgi:hypothetical protein
MAFGMLTFIAQLVLALCSLVYGVSIVLPEITDYGYGLYLIAPMLFEIGTISGGVLAAYYIALVVVIVVSAAWVFITSAKGYHKELTTQAKPRQHSAIFEVCGLMFGVLFLNVLVVLITGVIWEEPTSPVEEYQLWELLFLLANASVWEEFAVRVLLIGVPMILVDLVRRTPKDKIYRYLLGGGFHIGAPEVALVLLSSALFGFAHLEGWGAWKVFPSAVAGVAFGYLFIKYGLASAILLHFGFDYLSIPLELLTDSSDMSALLLFGLATLIWVGMGAVFFVYFLLRIFEFLTDKQFLDDRRPFSPYTRPMPIWAPEYPPPQTVTDAYQTESVTPPPQVVLPRTGGFFICPVCGYPEARWTDGRLMCLRCGTMF